MLTSGYSSIDDSFKKNNTISSTHKVIAEWNQNAYKKIDYIGTYPLYLNPGSTSPEQPEHTKTFISNQESGGWDNGGYFHTISSTGTDRYIENNDRKKTMPLSSIVEPERPDPGIINGIIIKNLDPTIPGNTPSIISDAAESRVHNILQNKNRLYPANETQGFKYWTSVRYPKPNTLKGITSKIIGVSDNEYKIEGNNAFVYYGQNSTVLTNKIVVKTQTVNGFPEDFKVEIIRSSDTTNTWTTIFTENSSSRTARAITKTANAVSGSYFITLNNHSELYVGMNVSGDGIQNDTKIIAISLDGVVQVDKLTSSGIVNGTLSFVDYPFSDGILRLTGSKTNENISWSISGGIESEANITNLTQDALADGITELESIKAIRFSVQKLSKKNGTLDLIEISPRLVVDMTGYVSSFDISSSIGDQVLGLPIGSMVSTSGSIQFFNYDKMITNKNSDSILYGLLKPNVKFTILSILKEDNITKYVPLKVVYSDTWDEASDSTVTTSLEDYLKFLRYKSAPDILTGALDGIKVSALIKILLDNAGFSRFSFEKTGEEEEYDSEDTRVDFFWSKKEFSVAEILDALASSTQLSIFVDQFGNIVAKTKEAVVQRTDTYDYWLVGDHKAVTESDAEYGFINNKYISNIEVFEDQISPPITAGEVSYSNLGISRESATLSEQAYRSDPTAGLTASVQKILESGFSQISLNRNLSYKPQAVWKIGQSDNSIGEGILSSGILIRNIENLKPKSFFDAITNTQKYPIKAKNKNDAIRKAFNLLSDTQKLSAEIVISESSLTVGFQDKFSGYVLADTELIKYNGIRYLVSKPGYYTDSKIYFSKQELDSDIAKSPSGSNFIPYSLIVDLDMQIAEYPVTNSSTYKFYCKDDGRASDGTLIAQHSSGLDRAYRWSRFGIKLFGSTSEQESQLGQDLTIAIDTGIPDITDVTKNSFAYGGYAKLSGPPSNKIENQDLGTEINDSKVRIRYPGQQWITGYRRDLDFIPSKIGTRMNLFREFNSLESVSLIGGVGFYLSEINNGPDGYFLEVSSASEAYNSNGVADDNIKLYKVKTVDGRKIPTVIGTAYSPVTSVDGSAEAINYLNDMNKLDTSTKSVFGLDISVSGPNQAGSTKTFIVKIDGVTAMTVTDTSSLEATNDVAMFVRDDSSIVVDHFYSVTQDASNYVPIRSNNAENVFYNDIINRNRRGSFSPFIASLYGRPEEIFYDDFGNTIREVRKVEARFQEPVFDSRLIELSEVSPDYYIRDYRSTSFGASFWIYNTTNGIIPIGDGSLFPIFISGMVLKKLSSGSVDIEQYINARTKEDETNNTVQLNRRLYGNQSLEISGEYLNNRYEAERLAEWVAKYATTEKISINATIFPNPLLQLGDKIKVFYKDKGYRKAEIGDKVYTLSGITYSVTESGMTMDVELRECI